ncbi:Uncharacterised protein [Mycobacteroides abscessus subsp. massiliense]|uniref:hypothetical protein n=1 Tax=Mycobacteroides abscessus TaxID=36809 RepID=UPI0009A7143B|nr:hypothetical protein [Mycobacteroides abscessus]SKY32304.1 Uncharacterised protein [Mycobacteroides abscessus subsp. massiliense]SKY73290.1 Uncharacterised protein [Mycobacteroides abscessus subsp. massiliense]
MAGRLDANSDGLRSGAARSDAVASSLSNGPTIASGGQPSHAGVAAILSAAAAVRDSQAQRVSGHADILRSGAGAYDGTEGRGAADIAKAM